MTLKAEIEAMSNSELLNDFTRSTRVAWSDFLFAKTWEERKKVIRGKKYHREKRLATEVLRRMDSSS